MTRHTRRSLIAAHRGGAQLWPENSLTAFRQAIALGVDLIELDVRLSADGQVVVIHDGTLNRTTTGSGPVDAQSAAALASLRLKGPHGEIAEGVPTLVQVLELLASSTTGLLLEFKSPGISVAYERRGDRVVAIAGPRYEQLEENTLAVLAASGLGARTTLMAFNPDVLRRLGELAPGHRRSLLVGAGHVTMAQATPEDTIEWARELGATDVGLEHTLLSPRVVARARSAGLALGVWTVNDEAAIVSALELGVDALTTDRPDLALRLAAAQ